MKNIHILPTDKPSRLFDDGIDLYLGELKDRKGHPVTSYNIYITSDEEIKEGDWVLNISNNKIFKQDNSKYDGYTLSFYKKIILTTDELYIHNDLIPKEYNPFPQYIQKIDIEFLEWFVKNPSCEEVFLTNDFEQVNQDNPILRGSTNVVHKYKIIIPKEEPKKIDHSKVIKVLPRMVKESFPKKQSKQEQVGYVEPKQETLGLLEVLMPIENKGISSWNKSNTIPEFDGEYLCYISCRQECGYVHRYYKVVSNSFNTWLINENERISLWKELPKNPFND